MMRTTDRLVDLLATVNGTAIDEDGGTPGEHIERLCREASSRMRAMIEIDISVGDRMARLHLENINLRAENALLQRESRTLREALAAAGITS